MKQICANDCAGTNCKCAETDDWFDYEDRCLSEISLPSIPMTEDNCQFMDDVLSELDGMVEVIK